MNSDKQTVIGEIKITITRGDGTVEEHVIPNIVTTVGKQHFAALLVADPGAGIPRDYPNPLLAIAVGDGTDAPVVGDTVLGNELKRYLFSGIEPVATGGVAQFMAIVPPDSLDGPFPVTVSEAGLFNLFVDEDTEGGQMTNRALIGPYNLNQTDALAIVWSITFP